MFSRNKKSNNEPARRRRAKEDFPSSTTGKYTRSRTLAGYTSESSGGRNSSERQRVHRVKARQKQAIISLGLLTMVTMTIGFMIFNFTANVVVDAVSDQANVVNSPDSSIYIKDINQYLDQSPSSRFRFSLNLEDLSIFVSHLSPEVKYIKRGSFAGLGITKYDIVFREPIIKWEAGNDTYYVDSEGVSFQKNIFSEPAVELRDTSVAGGVVQDGSVKISRRILEFSGRLVAAIQEDGYKAEYLSLPESTTRQVAVKLDGYSAEYIFSIDYPVATQVDSMHQAMEYLKGKEQPSRVDLRVPQRVYYR